MIVWYGMVWYDIWYDMMCDMTWYDMIWHDMIWYDMILYDMLYDMIWYDVIWHDMILCDMIWYDMIWYDMIWYDMTWYIIWQWRHNTSEKRCGIPPTVALVSARTFLEKLISHPHWGNVHRSSFALLRFVTLCFGEHPELVQSNSVGDQERHGMVLAGEVLRWCYDVMMVLWWCYDDVMMMLWSGVMIMLW